MDYDFDLIVIGSGAGGGTFAWAASRAGKRVLLVERGERPAANSDGHDEQATLIDKRPYDDRTVRVNGVARQLYVGGVLGGSTTLYGAALLRPSEDDFHPGRYYGNRLPRAVWDWPITYRDLEPYYQEAERLYGVAGSATDEYGPLGRPRDGYPNESLPLQPINRRLMAANQARGLQPFRLPLAIDPSRCLRCGSCAGYVCPTGARASSAQLLDPADATDTPLHTLTGAEVHSFSQNGRGEVEGVRVRDRATGKEQVFRARRYVLAAGALASPLILLRSRIDHPLIGRNYMFHLSPVVAGIFRKRTGADATFVKQVGFADYYFGTKRFAHKLGIIQSLPVPGPKMMAKAGPRRMPKGLVRFLRERMLPLCGIVEDLPNPANRVLLDRDGRVILRHSFGRYDIERGLRLARLMAIILRRAGAMFCLTKPYMSEEHAAHQCGTLRFGRDPVAAVADPDGRLFGHRNVFVVDGSLFPTSLGVGPALTIMANALRVARVVVREV
ncbi:choline dehydrogenase [Planctomycetaceae bacterium SCGC AG-212-F19]|nr:choline dehydrogenase [Planctomycetaceae bacterium SCGC AG-212-F19]